MTANDPTRLRGGYCEYPGVTPPGNPDWWAREIVSPSVPPAVKAVERRAEPEPTPVPAEPITAVLEPIKPRIDGTGDLARYWITQRTAATAPAPAPGEPRRWWHYLTTRRRKETKTP